MFISVYILCDGPVALIILQLKIVIGTYFVLTYMRVIFCFGIIAYVL